VPKVQFKPIKRLKLGFKRKSKRNRSKPWFGAPDSVRCTRVDRLQTLHLRVSEVALRYNAPDCPVCQRSNGSQAQRSTPTVACNMNSARTVRAESEQRQKAHRTVNSDCPVLHRTVRWPRLSELQRFKPSEP
jgi:hypothetical protein